MLKWIRLCSWMLTVPPFLVCQAADVGAATAEETLAKINRLPTAEQRCWDASVFGSSKFQVQSSKRGSLIPVSPLNIEL